MPTRWDLLRAFVLGKRADPSRGLDMSMTGVHRIADPELGPVIRECWGGGSEDADIRDYLLRLIWVGKVESCADLVESVATDPTESSYRRILAIRALLSCGNQVVVRELAEDMITSPASWPAKIIYGVVEDLFLHAIDVGGVGCTDGESARAIYIAWKWLRMAFSPNHRHHRSGIGCGRLSPEPGCKSNLAGLRTHTVIRIWYIALFHHLASGLAKLCGRQLSLSASSRSVELIRACVIACRFGNNAIDVQKSIPALKEYFATAYDIAEGSFLGRTRFARRDRRDGRFAETILSCMRRRLGQFTHNRRPVLARGCPCRRRPPRTSGDRSLSSDPVVVPGRPSRV